MSHSLTKQVNPGEGTIALLSLQMVEALYDYEE